MYCLNKNTSINLSSIYLSKNRNDIYFGKNIQLKQINKNFLPSKKILKENFELKF